MYYLVYIEKYYIHFVNIIFVLKTINDADLTLTYFLKMCSDYY